MENTDFDILSGKAAAYCSLSEHCIAEVSEKLTIWGANKQQTEKIIAYLVQENYLDEQRFARAYMRDKFRFNRWGKIKIALMLRSKNIDNEIINAVLKEIDEQEYSAAILELLRSKSKSVKANSQWEKNAKLLRFAQSRGFEYAQVEKILRNSATL